MSKAPEPEDFTRKISLLLKRVEYRLVSTGTKEFTDIARLRYKFYRSSDSIPKSPDQLLQDPFDIIGNVFGIYIDDTLASTIRIEYNDLVNGTLHSPGAIVTALKESGISRFVAGNYFAADIDISRKYPQIAYITIRVLLAAYEYYQSDCIAMIARAEHEAFYRRIFGMKIHPTLFNIAPILFPMGIFYANNPEMSKIYRRYPFLEQTSIERRMLFQKLPDNKFIRRHAESRHENDSEDDPFSRVDARIIFQTPHPKEVDNLVRIVGQLMKAEGYTISVKSTEELSLGDVELYNLGRLVA